MVAPAGPVARAELRRRVDAEPQLPILPADIGEFHRPNWET